MSTTEAFSAATVDDRGDLEYRPLNSAAAASVVFGLLSALVALAGRESLEGALMWAPLPLLGLALGFRSLRRMRENPDLYTGRGAAWGGIILSGLGLAGGLAFAGYVRATEFPPDYARVSFADLRPSDVELRGNRVIPAAIEALDGKRVAIKGYMRPGTHYSEGGAAVNQHIKQFLLVRDNNQCCFGDLSAVQYFDQVAVKLGGALTVDYDSGLYKIGGVLRLQPGNLAGGRGGPVYQLEADLAK
jgi:hypothetical protein